MQFRASPGHAAVAAAFAVAVALLLPTPAASAASTASAPCWQRVISDWSDNGTIGGRYSNACLEAAQRNAPTDLRIYSTLEDDLQRALQSHAARRVASASAHGTVEVASTAPGSSSSFTLLTALLAGLGALLTAVWAAALLFRRRPSGRP